MDNGGGSIGRAFAWWTGELASLVPASATSRIGAPAADMVIALNDGRLALANSNTINRRASRSSVTLDAETREQAVWTALARARRRRRPVRIALTVPLETCFQRRLEMPVAARRDLPRMLALDLERATPFKAADIYWAHYVEPGRASSGALVVHQLILRKGTVAEAVAALEAEGGTVVAISPARDRDPALPHIDFLAETARRNAVSGSTGKGRAAAALASGILLAVFSALWLDASRHETALATLEAETAALRARIADSDQRDLAAAAERSASEAALALKTTRALVVEVLDELTRLVPDTAWLAELRMEQGALDLAGYAEPAAVLVPILERSELFTAAALTAPVTLDTDSGKERFSLNVQMRGAPVAAEDIAPTQSEGEDENLPFADPTPADGELP